MRYFVLFFLMLTVALGKNYSRDYDPSAGDAVELDVLEELDRFGTILYRNIETSNITDASIVNADFAGNSLTNDNFAEIPFSVLKEGSSGQLSLQETFYETPYVSDYAGAAGFEFLMQVHSNSGCWLYRVDDDTLGITAGGGIFYEGRIRYRSSAVTFDPSVDASYWYDIFIEADNATAVWDVIQASASDLNIGVDSGGPTGDQRKYGRMVGSFFTNSAGDIACVVNYRGDNIVGWVFEVGSGSQSTDVTTTILSGPYSSADRLSTVYMTSYGMSTALGVAAAEPTALGDFATLAKFASIKNISWIGLLIEPFGEMLTDTGNTFDNTKYYAHCFLLQGRFD